MMDNKSLRNSGFVKTILMLLVIFGHACAFWSGNWFLENPAIESRSLNLVYSWINSFHIYAFALASGYLFAFKILGGGYDAYVPFLQNKAKRLLIPYVFVMASWVVPISTYFFHWDLPYLFERYILCINPSQLWFLWMLFGVFAIVWPLRKVMMEKPTLSWLIAIVIYGVGTVGKKIVPNVFCIWTACQYVPVFYVGIRIRAKEENGEKGIIETVPWYIWIILDLVVFIVDIFVGRQSGAIWSPLDSVLSFFLHMIGAVMAWTTLQTFANKTNWKDRRFFKTLSSYSMPMYLFHQQMIYFTIVALNGRVHPWINAGVNFMVASVGSFLISSILMHWKTTRLLIGEK